MKNWLLAELGLLAPRHADNSALERNLGKLGLQVRMLRAAGAVAVLAVTGLRHEAVDHPMERHVIIKSFARQKLHPLGMLGAPRRRVA